MARQGKGSSQQVAPPTSFHEVLDQVDPRPRDDAEQSQKKNYAESFSNRIAVWLAGALRATGGFPGILPNPDGSGRESKVASGVSKKPKKTDVRFGTADTGLELLVSVKTLSFRDARKDRKTGTVILGRYTKNMVRNDHELRAEAMDLHERFPYAVLVGLLFLPFSACDDGKEDKSSFAHAVMTLRPRSGRVRPTDPHQLFERIFIALYEHEGSSRGDIMFFDVTTNPPRRGRPKVGLIGKDALVHEIVKAYGIRNRRYVEWADEAPGAAAPLLETPTEESDETDETDS
jgi:hypothetical protein